MRIFLTSLIAAALLGGLATGPVLAEPSGWYEVSGVEPDDMLKMRLGPGVGYKVLVGLPNGTVVWVQSCTREGKTSWCKVSLKAARSLKGYVSAAYLTKK
jgi:uncharacterized protein YraI